MVRQILFFGSSSVLSCWDSEGGFVQRIRKWLDAEEKDILVYNLGIYGNTSKRLLDRIEVESKARIEKNSETLFLFQIGSNDSAFLKQHNANWVSIENFKSNLIKLIEIAQAFKPCKIVFVGLTSVIEAKTMPIPQFPNVFYSNKNVAEYDAVIKQVCKEKNILFLDLLNELSKFKQTEIQFKDGLHLNSKGHEKAFDLVKAFLIKNKLIE